MYDSWVREDVFLTHLLIGEISISDLHKGHSTQNPFCLYLWVAKGMIKNWCHSAHKSNKKNRFKFPFFFKGITLGSVALLQSSRYAQSALPSVQDPLYWF